jgi:hypothetical protein
MLYITPVSKNDLNTAWYKTSDDAPISSDCNVTQLFWAIFNGREPANFNAIVEVKMDELPLNVVEKLKLSPDHNHAGLGKLVIERDDVNKNHDVFFEVHRGKKFNSHSWRWEPEHDPWYVAKDIIHIYMGIDYATEKQLKYYEMMTNVYFANRD